MTGESDDEDQPEETLALCAEAEGYYVDRPPPARDLYELRGCAPEGELARAAAQAQKDGTAPLDLLTVRALDQNGRPVEPDWEMWCLGHARVLTVRPGFADPALVDITVEGTLDDWLVGDEQPEIPEVPPLYQGFHLYGRGDEPWGSCRQVALVDKRPEPETTPLRLLGCEPGGRLLAALEGGEDQFELGGAYFGPIDRAGRAIVEHWICLHIESWSRSGAGGGRVDLTLDISCTDFRSAGSRRAHELWAAGPPSEPNLWAELDTIGRAA
ncbi:MAG TPA: hypothetical protein VFH94_03125, partial [Streptomyces sp.]|nr:hypothetical protein [Streptomyces sp.]